MVHVKQGDSTEQGTFMLTTVGVMDANALTYLWANLTRGQIEKKVAVYQPGETEQQYNQRQVYKMITSQSNAVEAAYKKLGVPYKVQNEGIMIMGVSKGLPAEKVLQTGDVLFAVDGKAVASTDEIIQIIQSKKEGDSVKVTFKRGDVLKTEEIPLTLLPVPSPAPGATPNPEASSQPRRVGIGVTFETGYDRMVSIQAEQEEKQVTIAAGDIGGPSAGLMFSLEIYNQLVPEDITKGYRIAGTGTIDTNGNVGVIGGIEHKIVAADREKAEIFFAPKDWTPPAGMKGSPVPNTTDAQKQAKKIGSKMKIVSVGNMSDALSYLQSLPPKSEKK